MGQKIEYDPQDWDGFHEEDELLQVNSEISLPEDFFKQSADSVPLDDSEQLDIEHSELDEAEITAYIGGEKVQFKHRKADGEPVSQEEEAFRRQIEDLFELLELEKESHSTEGVRVYQTDSSPSRPWRFH